MPHQCVHCSELYEDAAPELLKGCVCGGHFFYYIKKEYADMLKKGQNIEKVDDTIAALSNADKVQVERDVREMMGVEKEDVPVILDLESVRVLKPGKFEIDVVNLFRKKRPVIYKLEEGKYVIDLASTIKASQADVEKLIKNPEAK